MKNESISSAGKSLSAFVTASAVAKAFRVLGGPRLVHSDRRERGSSEES